MGSTHQSFTAVASSQEKICLTSKNSQFRRWFGHLREHSSWKSLSSNAYHVFRGTSAAAERSSKLPGEDVMGFFQAVRKNRENLMDSGDVEYEEETGLDLFLRLGAPWLVLKSGCPDVDSLLKGGIIRGEVTEFVGGVAAGKTQLCLSLAAEMLISDEAQSNNVVYIDTNGSFRSSRLLQMLKCRGVQDENARETILKRVLLARAYDETDLRNALITTENVENLSLVIIDSIGAALAFTALSYFEGGREAQEEVIARLHCIARRGCAIVTTNHFVYWRGQPSPSLGLKWIRAVDSRYLLSKLQHSAYYMQLIHSRRYKLSGEKAFYAISQKGIDSLEEDLHKQQTQNAEPVITQNWDTIKQIYS